MDNKKVTLIVKATINKNEMESFHAYIARLTELYAQVKAESIGHFPVNETFVGSDLPSFFALFVFENKDAINAIYETEEYKSTMIPLRNKAFKALEVYLS